MTSPATIDPIWPGRTWAVFSRALAGDMTEIKSLKRVIAVASSALPGTTMPWATVSCKVS